MESTVIDALCGEIRNILMAHRQRIAEEISRHPRPITACDVHFNRLLEERVLISQELDRFDALHGWQIEVIERFVSASTVLGEQEKARIRRSLKNVVCP